MGVETCVQEWDGPTIGLAFGLALLGSTTSVQLIEEVGPLCLICLR